MSKALISENLKNSLIEQYGHEKFNANVYLYVAAFLKNKGLNKLAKHFEQQHDEEIEHSKLIYEFITDMNADFKSVEINEINFPINTIMDIAKKYLESEQLTTESLMAIRQICIDEQNGVAEEFLRQMIDKQRNELAETLDFIDNAELCANDWWKVKVWSDGLEG